MTEIIEFAKAYGLPMALVVAFIWRTFARENVLSRRLTEIEDYQRNHLTTLVADTTSALKENTKSMTAVCDALQRRPCIAGDLRREGAPQI